MRSFLILIVTLLSLSGNAKDRDAYELCLESGDYWITQGYIYIDHYSTSDSWCSDIVNNGEVICRDVLNLYKYYNQIDMHVRDMCYGVQNAVQGNCIAQVLKESNYHEINLKKLISNCN